jgi:hypothetical protein
MLDTRHVVATEQARQLQEQHPLEVEQLADRIRLAVEGRLQEFRPELDPRVIVYPRRERMLLVWDGPGGEVRTHWVSYEGIQHPTSPAYFAYLAGLAVGALMRREREN